MSKTNKKSSKLWWLTPLILCLFIGTILTLVLCFIFNIRYKSVDENVENGISCWLTAKFLHRWCLEK